MSRWFLGIDTSNYRTSAALFDADTMQWYNENRLLDVPAERIGLRQSEALFQHTVQLHKVIERLPQQSICGVGVSTRPRAVEGSYMPCFLAGENVARSIAHVLNIPVFHCSHQQGHLVAAALSAQVLDWVLHTPFYAWHVSGGTMELLQVTPDEGGKVQAVCIGGTNDLTAGQLIDRTGAALGLKFPAGEELEKLSNRAQCISKFRPKVKNSVFSLSGIENKVKELVEKQVCSSEIAAFTIHTIGEAMLEATRQAISKQPLPILCAGGVMANQFLQKMMQNHFQAKIAEPSLSGDNAVGVAALAALQYGER